MQGKQLWTYVRRHAHQIFPALAAVMAAVILTSPFYPWPLSWISDAALGRFVMFWALSVFVVLAFMNRRWRPRSVLFLSIAITIVVGTVFMVLCLPTMGLGLSSDAVPEIVLSCLSGTILGALAGTWLIYVLEVYWG